MSRAALLLPLLLALGCQQYTAVVCDELAMKKYQGWPKESNEYDRNCKDKVHHPTTVQICQKALELLIVEGREERLKKTFGEKIMGCFTQDDLRRFLKQ